MKNAFIACIFAIALVLALPSLLQAQAEKQSATATVVSVQEKNGVDPTSYAGSNPSDAPLQSTYYAYDIAVRLNCTQYVVHYESASNYLPSAFAANHQIRARMDKHRMYFEVPGYGQMELPIVGHSRVKDCASSGSARS